jgi:hypothetical protein
VKARWAVQRQIAAGFSAAQIAEVQERITGGVIPEWLTAESPRGSPRIPGNGHLIAAHWAAGTTQSTTAARAAEYQEEGSAVSAEPDPAPEIRPATQWQKGALTAHQIITAQAAAGYSADRIAGKWEGALATYDDATATAEERQWHQGASETAADMIQTLRDMERAEAEQAQVDRDQAARDQARPELEAEAG